MQAEKVDNSQWMELAHSRVVYDNVTEHYKFSCSAIELLAIALRTIAIAIVAKKAIEYWNMQ